MPSNLTCTDSERAFIGCLVAGEGEALDVCAASEEHFVDPVARAIFIVSRNLHEAGSPVSVGTVLQKLGAGQIAELGGIGQVREVCNFPEPDHAEHYFEIIEGKLTLRRALRMARWATEEIEATTNPMEFVNELHRRVAGVQASSDSENVLPSALDAFAARLGRIEAGKSENGLQTSVVAWNKIFGGVLEGQLYGVAGRPGTGKTALMEMLICDFLGKEHPVCVFERDMSPQKLVERIACRLMRVPYWKLSRGLLHPDECVKLRNAIELLRAMPLIIHNPTGLTPERMCAIARRDIRVRGAKAVFLDHIQTFGQGRDMREKLTQASLYIRDSVTTTNVPHIVLAHVNRNGAKGRPAPEDIKEFDQLYGDADGMLLLWSEQEKTKLKKGELLEVNFYGAKNRDGGVVECEMLFDGELMKFVDKAKTTP